MDDQSYPTSCVKVYKEPEKTALKSQRLRNPFLVKIDTKSTTGVDCFEHGLRLNIVCECSFWIFSFWNVKIADFHHKLAFDWTTIKNLLIDGKFNAENFAAFANDPELYQDEYNKIDHKIEGPKEVGLKPSGSNVRDRYPLVIMLALNDRNIEDQVEVNDVVLLVSVIHIKDNNIPLDTHIMAQFIKRKSGIVLNLQDLYISTDVDDNSPYCVICQENAINRAILPCKHTCVCSECFERIDLCPLCRERIVNYLEINNQAQLYQIDENVNKPSDKKDDDKNDQHQSRGFFSKFKSFIGL